MAGELLITEHDTIIALMGMTGVGKSSFIEPFTHQKVPIGTDLESCTEVCQLYHCSLPGSNKTFWLADTPGFDDSKRSDYEILRELSSWLAKSYSERIKLTGIIYLHRILDVRLGGTGMRNLRMFKKLVGENNLNSIVLATTFWGNVDKGTGDMREYQLSNTEDFWGSMIKKGSRVFRHDRGVCSGQDIIQYLLDRDEKAAYDIQREMVDHNKQLDQTAAGAEVQEQVEKLRLKYEQQLKGLRDELQEAMRSKDEEWQQEVKKLQVAHEAWLENHKKEQEKVAAHTQELWETRQREREEARERQYKEILELQRVHSEQNAIAIAQHKDDEMKLKLENQKQRLQILRMKQEAAAGMCNVM